MNNEGGPAIIAERNAPGKLGIGFA